MNSTSDETWLDFTEESILLQDDVYRIADLVELPSEDECPLDSEYRSQLLLSLKTDDTEKLCGRLKQLCQNDKGFTQLLHYRINALKGLWRAKANKEKALQANSKKDTKACINKKTLAEEGQSSSFSSKLGLLLLFPLIKSQSKTDPEICLTTTQLLLESLRTCPPLSLKEPVECLNGIEDLLCSWLGENGVGGGHELNQSSLRVATSALVTLACARNSLQTVIHTIYLLEQLRHLEELPVHDIIFILGALDGGPGVPPTLNTSRHVNCWPYDDQLTKGGTPEGDNGGPEVLRRSMTTDGTYLFVTNYRGCGLAKIGSGLHGSMKAHVYAKNSEHETGFIAFANGILLHRTKTMDQQENCLGAVINQHTLEVIQDLEMIPDLRIDCDEQLISTLNLISNGQEFFWIRSLNICDSSSAQCSAIIILDCFTVDPTTNAVRIFPPRRILRKKDDQYQDSVDNIIKSSRHVSVNDQSGVTPQNTAKDQGSTSLGLSMKILQSSAMITCGNFLTIIAPHSASTPTTQLARTLFNATSAKTNANCHIFSLKDGLFHQKTEVSDLLNSGFTKGTISSSLCATYDNFNNSIWTCSSEYLDQFHSPGHQSLTYCRQKLGLLDNKIQRQVSCENNMVSTNDIISTLMTHMGLMCLHHISSEPPFNKQLHSGESKTATQNLNRVQQLLTQALKQSEERTCLCLLMAVQYIFKTNSFEDGCKEDFVALKSTLLDIVERNSKDDIELNRTTEEACNTLLASLNVLFPSESSQIELIKTCLQKVGRGFEHLTNLLLKRLSKVFDPSNENSLREKLIHSRKLNMRILEMCFEQDFALIKKVSQQSIDFYDQEFFSTYPRINPSLQYISNLTKHILANYLVKEDGPKEDQKVILNAIIEGSLIVVQEISKVHEQITSECLEIILKSSIIGLAFFPIITVFCNESYIKIQNSQEMVTKVMPLLDTVCKLYSKTEGNEQTCAFSKLSFPSPWSRGKILESPHPLKDNYKYKETVKIFGAQCLYLKFDERCATQYDYDKLVVYAGKELLNNFALKPVNHH